MTIEIGNKNTGIPMGSYSPGSGGGGGSVEPPDLSNYYTKQDVDAKLVDKQNTFYTGKALEMKIVTSENVVGFTDNGSTITKNSGIRSSFGGMTGSNPSAYTYFYQETDSKKLDVAISIPIPQKGSPIIMFPMAVGENFALGYYDEDGYFIPLLTRIDIESESYPFNCQYCAIGNYLKTEQEQSGSTYYNRSYFDSVRRFYQSASNGAKTIVNTSDEGLTNVISTYGTNGFFQPHRNEDNKIVALGSWAVPSQNYGIAMSMNNRVGQDILNTLDKCTHFVITAYSDTTFNKKDFGVFETKDRVYWDFKALHSTLSTLENTIDLFSESTTETLVLNTTDNLQISGGALDIGTAVTAQGNTFNGASQLVQLDSDGKLPAIDGSQLTGISSNGFPSSQTMTNNDFNSYITEGLYFWSGYTVPTNHPDSNMSGYLMVLSCGKGFEVKQIFFEVDGRLVGAPAATAANKMFMRTCISNASPGYAWGNWVQLATGDTSSMVTTNTEQTITGIKTFPAYTKFNDTIQFTGSLCRIQNEYGNNLFLDDRVGNTLHLGEESRTTILSNTVQNGSGKKFLVQGSITSGSDNLVISETVDGIQIASTNNTGNLKYWTGTEANYTAIETKDADTLYRTTDTNKVFLGTIQIGGNA